jgi:sulfhydrogenase subunit beta (sulfur reductase)
LDDLIQTRQVYAPTPQENGLFGFERLQSGSQAALDFYNAKRAPKEMFFPRTEVLFSYRNGEVVAAPLPDGQRVIWGIRPCDARSFALLDRVFNTPERPDPYYGARRENTLLVGLGCNQPSRTCFCTAVGGAPFSTEGLDVLLTDLGDHCLAESLNERGEALLAGDARFHEASAEDMAAKEQIAVRALAAVNGPSVAGVKERLDRMYDDPFWDQLQEKCLGCGACTFLCPTCHCFDIQDEAAEGNGRRVRHWDSCQFSLFTRHASGHNPRPSSKERMRQRVMHKFRYFVDNYDEIACVGCGRCVRDCPVNLDIRAVLQAISERAS